MGFDFFAMDVTSIFLGVSICLVLSIVVYLISAFGTKEKSFEQALEEQKKRSLEEEMQQRQEKGKKDKEKKFKKWSKRKDKGEAQECEKLEIPVHDSQTNELVGDIEIVEPREIHPRRKGKVPSKVTTSKSESSPSSEEIELIEHLAKPSGDAKLVSTEKRKVEKPPPKEKDVPKVDLKDKEIPKVKVNEPQVTPVTDEEVQSTSDTSSATPTKKKKKDVADKTTDFSGFTVSRMIQFLKETELGDEESQMLIDVLLNKQKDASEWKKKNDPLATMKKQLQEKEQVLEVEQSQRQAATAKLKELKQEYTQEKTRASAQERHFQEKITQQLQEIKSLTLRIKQIQEQLGAEKSSSQEKMQQLQSSLEEKYETIVTVLQEEKAQLQKAVAKLESSARSKPSITEVETKLENLKKSRDDLQKVHGLLVEQHTLLIGNHKAEVDKLNAQLSEAKRMVNETNESQRSVTEEVEALRGRCENLEAAKCALEQQLHSAGSDTRELENLRAQLEEAQGKCRNLEAQMFHLSECVNDLTQKNTSQMSQFQHLQQENDRLSLELQSVTVNDMQSSVHQNGDVNEKENELLQKSIAEKEIILEEKEKQLQQVHEELQKQRSQVATLSGDLEAQKQKNNELREKNWKAMDALSAAERSADQKIQETQRLANEKIIGFQKELERQAKLAEDKNSVEKSCKELSEKLRDAEERLLSYQDEAEGKSHVYQRESEERVKQLNLELQRVQDLHRFAERRISEIEGTVEDLKSDVLKTQNNTKKCLQRIFPDVTIDNSVSHDVWLLRFEEQALAVLKAMSTHSGQVDELLAKIADVENEKAELLQAVQHYKTVLADTEMLLNRLQHSAESTESVWKDKLNVKEQELAAALKEKENLVSEKENLQTTIDQMGRLDEMQEKLKLLQNTIESAENERAHLQLKYEEVNNNYINLQDLIKSKDQKILELQKSLASLEDIQKELKDVKSKLEKEAKINKDLSAQTVKLSSLVKIGQDSLKTEQDLVSQLKSQLETLQSCTATTNGTSSPSLAIPENEDSSFKK